MAVKLEVGKRYVRRDGRVSDLVTLSGVPDSVHKFKCDGGCYTEDGRVFVNVGVDDDLITEYVDDNAGKVPYTKSMLIHIYHPPTDPWQLQRLAPHLQISSDTPQRTTYGPVAIPEHVVKGLASPERQAELVKELNRVHGHRIVRIELEAIN